MGNSGVELESERLLIRMAGPDDAQAVLDYYSDNRKHLHDFEPLRADEFYTIEYWEKKITESAAEHVAGRGLRMFIFLKTDPERVIGSINYSNFMRGCFQACNLGCSIAAEHEGKGFMSEALRATNRFMFEELGFHRIMANYVPHNRRSAELLKRLGFTAEGYARDYLKIQGQWQDHILTSLISPDPA